jgi:hypothetical protein
VSICRNEELLVKPGVGQGELHFTDIGFAFSSKCPLCWGHNEELLTKQAGWLDGPGYVT